MSVSDLKKSVIITGGADGIGQAIATKFLAEGFSVHICDNRAEPLAAMLSDHPGMHGTVADVSEISDVTRLFAEACEWMGGVGTLVNNVGIGGPRAGVEAIDHAGWESTFRVNVLGTLQCMQAAIRDMKPRGGGAIINISTASTRTRLPYRTAYVASKFAVEGLTLNAARELGPVGIRCNALLPGVMNNVRMDGIIAARAEREGRTASEVEQDFLRYVSLRARTDPEDVAETAFFLASRAGARITGELISVSGCLEWEE